MTTPTFNNEIMAAVPHPPEFPPAAKELPVQVIEPAAMVTVAFPDLKTLSDQELAEKIRAKDSELCELMEVTLTTVQQSVETVIATGNALLEARRRCSHGEWGPWQKQHLPGIPPSRISRYLAAAEEIPHVRNLDAIKTVRQLYIACGVIKTPERKQQTRSSKEGSVCKPGKKKSPKDDDKSSSRSAVTATNQQDDDGETPFHLADGTVLASDTFQEGWITPDWLTRKMQNIETLAKPTSSMEKQWCAQAQRIMKGLADVLNKELGTVPTNDGLHEAEDILTELMNFTVTHSSYKRAS